MGWAEESNQDLVLLLLDFEYVAACWNPNPRMTTQIRGVIRNFIWGGKDAPACAKVKWDTLTLPTTQGGMGIIDPKAQSEALLAKLLIRGLAPGGEPWKELIRHKADQIRLPIHSKGPNTPDATGSLPRRRSRGIHAQYGRA
jgi:hypothetical protein